MKTVVTFNSKQGKKFQYCLKVVRKFRGDFNPRTKEWTLPCKLEVCFVEDFDTVVFVEEESDRSSTGRAPDLCSGPEMAASDTRKVAGSTPAGRNSQDSEVSHE